MTEITAAIELLMPPRVEIGLGSLTKLPEWVEARKVRRVLVVSGVVRWCRRPQRRARAVRLAFVHW